jgi:hypothetical protein
VEKIIIKSSADSTTTLSKPKHENKVIANLGAIKVEVNHCAIYANCESIKPLQHNAKFVSKVG